MTNLRYADNAVLITASMELLQDLVDRVENENKGREPFLNAEKSNKFPPSN